MRSDRDDELLADPPRGEHHLGALAGYRHGKLARRGVMVTLMATLIGATAFAVWWALRAPVGTRPEYTIEADGGPRPDALVWTTGTGRFALGGDPGVKAIELPDRIVTLADGCEHAQIRVEVADGRTVRLEILAGAIVERER